MPQGALMSSSSPLVLPAVSWPASNAVIGQLQDQLDTSPLYMDPETLSQLRLNASSPALLVFRLPYGIGYVHCTRSQPKMSLPTNGVNNQTLKITLSFRFLYRNDWNSVTKVNCKISFLIWTLRLNNSIYI